MRPGIVVGVIRRVVVLVVGRAIVVVVVGRAVVEVGRAVVVVGRAVVGGATGFDVVLATLAVVVVGSAVAVDVLVFVHSPPAEDGAAEDDVDARCDVVVGLCDSEGIRPGAATLEVKTLVVGSGGASVPAMPATPSDPARTPLAIFRLAMCSLGDWPLHNVHPAMPSPINPIKARTELNASTAQPA